MHYNHTKFRISDYVAELIKDAKIPAPTAKLLLALIFLQDQTEEGWPAANESYVVAKRFVLVSELRELGFPSNTRSSRFLRKPVADLACIPEIFNHLEIAPSGRYLTWEFSETFFENMSDMEVYGLLDASEIALCHGKHGAALLAQVPLHRRKRMPEFRLFGPNKTFLPRDGFVVEKLVPSTVERQLLPSLQCWANSTQMTFAVLFVQEGSLPGYTDVLIRIRHKETKWPEGRFNKRPVSARIRIVSPEKKCPSTDN